MKVALLGVGMMGEAVLSGLVRAGMSGSDLTVTDVRVERSDELVATYGVRFAEDAVDAVSGALGFGQRSVDVKDDGLQGRGLDFQRFFM